MRINIFNHSTNHKTPSEQNKSKGFILLRQRQCRVKMVSPAFTIIELIVVISIIGILATIGIVSYNGWRQSTTVAQLKSDLNGVAAAMEDARTFGNTYPPTIPSTFVHSSGVELTVGSSDGVTYCINAINSQFPSLNYHIHNNQEAQAGICEIPVSTVIIGTQTWMQNNLNIGAMVDGSPLSQTDNSIDEKWCYDNLESNCTIYGGLYSWPEAVQYLNGASYLTSPNPAFSGNIQGICPTGFHIPTDTEYKTLEMSLLMTQGQADAEGWRGTDQGIQLQEGGASGFNGLLGGRTSGSLFAGIGEWGTFMTSTNESDYYTRVRQLYAPGGIAESRVNRPDIYNSSKLSAMSVRCIKD